jgi:hypothetical protein
MQNMSLSFCLVLGSGVVVSPLWNGSPSLPSDDTTTYFGLAPKMRVDSSMQTRPKHDPKILLIFQVVLLGTCSQML